jgi:hypothetical protein
MLYTGRNCRKRRSIFVSPIPTDVSLADTCQARSVFTTVFDHVIFSFWGSFLCRSVGEWSGVSDQLTASNFRVKNSSWGGCRNGRPICVVASFIGRRARITPRALKTVVCKLTGHISPLVGYMSKKVCSWFGTSPRVLPSHLANWLDLLRISNITDTLHSFQPLWEYTWTEMSPLRWTQRRNIPVLYSSETQRRPLINL